jgi:serine protease AprX
VVAVRVVVLEVEIAEPVDGRVRLEDDEHDHANGYHAYAALPVGYTVLTGEQIATVAEWSEVRYVEANYEIELHNDDAREVTGARAVQEQLFYTGESVHAAVIDSGIDGDHPDHRTNLQHNYQFTNPLDRETMWVDVGPINTGGSGHGTHVSGTVAGDGTASDGEFRGMAPDADLTVYSTATPALLLFNIVGAYDHLIDRQRKGKTDVQVVNNSYGPISGNDTDFDPDDALNVATYMAFEEGILPVFSAGNSGPGTNTYSEYGKAPHVLGVAATDDQTAVTDFSSRGRKPSYDGITNYDRQAAFENLTELYETGSGSRPYGVYRPSVGATGSLVMSALAPEDALQGYPTLVGAEDQQGTEEFYGKVSGTSMSSPTTTGLVALVIDAYRQNTGEFPDPMDVINTVEATARDARPGHNVYNMGTGFTDVRAAVERAAAGDLAGFDEVTEADYASAGDAPEPVFVPTGSRADDGSVFTAGQTNQVDLTLETVDTAGDDRAVVRDTIPFDWDVVAGDSHTTYTEDGERFIEFDASVAAGETRTYFVEAPDSTGSYTFGPAEAEPADGTGVFDGFTDTETNEVAGVSS